MDKWTFGFLVLLFGLLLAVLIDRMRFKRGCGPGQRERNRWLSYWYRGRFPTREEEEEDERLCRAEEEKERLEEAKRRKDDGAGRK